MGLNYKYQAMFQVEAGRECLVEMEEAPKAVRLFGDFIYDGDFAVMCGDEGAGKSILGLQIADAISKGRPIDGFEMDCGAQPVMYLDFESKKNEFIRRYSEEGKNPHEFSDNFFRVTFNPKYYDYTGIRKQLLLELNHIFWRKPILVVVNNLEYLKCFAAESYILSVLKELQVHYKFTLLVLAGKRGSKSQPKAGVNQLSRSIRGMADSVFVLGRSKKGEGIRYAKQLKNSTGASVYHDKKVAAFTIGKTGNFTGLTFTGFEKEFPHVAEPPTGVDAEIIKLKLANPSLTYLEIAEQLDTYKMKVKRVLDKYAEMLEENSDTEILNSKSTFAEASADNPTSETVGAVVTSSFERGLSGLVDDTDGKATLPSASFRGDVGLTDHPSDSGVKQSEPLETVVTNNVEDAAATDASSFSNTPLQPGGLNKEDESSPCPLPLHTTSPQGGMPNAELVIETVEPLPSDPFRGDVGLTDHPSDSGVKQHPKTNPKLTYSQQVKKRLAEARKRK